MNLTNRTDMKEAFKMVACICATERVKQLNEAFKNEEPKPEHLLQALEETTEGWKKIKNEPLDQPIKKENNPFYLAIIKEGQKYDQAVKDLIDEYHQSQLKSLQLQPTED